MRCARLFIGWIVLLAAFLAACADAVPIGSTRATSEEAESQQQSSPVGATSRDPDRPAEIDSPIRFDIYSYKEIRHFADRMLEALAEERLWCEQQPQVAELRAMLDDHDPEDVWRSLLIAAEGDDLRAVEIIADATAEARGIALQELPPVFLISRTDLRRYACLSEETWEHDEEQVVDDDADEHEAVGDDEQDEQVDEQPAVADDVDEDQESSVGLPASRMAELISQDVEGYGDLEQSWLSATLSWGWYGEQQGASELEPGEDGIGEVVLVSSPPMPSFFTSVISHEMVHVLQDQWTGWQRHDWYRDATTTDQLQALRWVDEGDATLNEIYGDVSPLRDSLSDIEWGPREHAEYDLWLRAYETLMPQDSEIIYAAYEQGGVILAALRDERGQDAINELLLDPPESTEQMLHAEKLANDEQPISLVDLERLRDELLPAEQWNAPIMDRMGEHWLRSLIGTASKRHGIARKAAAGWGSDQMALWRSTDGETEVVTWQFVFDDPQEHREGLSGMRRWFFSHTANEAEAVFANMLSWDGPAGAAGHPPARRLVGRLERPRDCRRCRQRHPHPYLDQLLGGAVAVRDPESKRGDWSFPHECAVVGRR